MEKLLSKLASRTMFLILLSSGFLLSCQSTSADNEEPSCRTEVSDNCSAEEDMGDDRGFNPCLINKNLPVCKK